jgi:integrase
VLPARHREAWVRVRKAAKLPDTQPRFHDLRHTAATFFLAAGLRSHAVADILGHGDAGLVDRLYGHALPAEVNAAGTVLDTWIATRLATNGAVSGGNPC